VLLAGDVAVAPHTREREPPLVKMDLQILAAQPGQLRRDHVAVGGLVQIDGRHPARRAGGKPVEPLLDGEQVADRIPAGKGHPVDASTAVRVVPSSGSALTAMASLQATRLKRGMLVKMGEDLFRVLELQHVTPGNLRGFVRVKLRNIRSGTLSDQKL